MPTDLNTGVRDTKTNRAYRSTAGDPLPAKSMCEPYICVVSRCGLAVRRLAGKQKDLGSIGLGSPFSFLQKLWFMDTVL